MKIASLWAASGIAMLVGAFIVLRKLTKVNLKIKEVSFSVCLHNGLVKWLDKCTNAKSP